MDTGMLQAKYQQRINVLTNPCPFLCIIKDKIMMSRKTRLCFTAPSSFFPSGFKLSTTLNWVAQFTGNKTMKAPTLILTLCIVAAFSQAKPIATQPQPNESFKPNQTLQHLNEGNSCTFTVTIKTSCSSPSYTRDRISLSFGDAYGYQVYVPRLDDPYSGTFERCSTDTFELYGPCTYQICYLYLYRTGYDGWIPESVTVYGYNSRPVTFYYNTHIPNGIWYGFDYCYGYSSASKATA